MARREEEDDMPDEEGTRRDSQNVEEERETTEGSTTKGDTGKNGDSERDGDDDTMNSVGTSTFGDDTERSSADQDESVMSGSDQIDSSSSAGGEEVKEDQDAHDREETNSNEELKVADETNRTEKQGEKVTHQLEDAKQQVNKHGADGGASEVKVVSEEGDKGGFNDDATNDGTTAGEQETRESNEKVESVTLQREENCEKIEDQRKEDTGHEAIKTERTQAKTSAGRADDDEEKEPESENNSEEHKPDKSENKRNEGEDHKNEQKDRDQTLEKENGENHEDHQSARTKTGESENGNEEDYHQPETRSHVSLEGKPAGAKETSLSDDKNTERPPMKDSERIDARESEGDIVLNTEEAVQGSDEVDAAGIVEEETERKREEDFPADDNAAVIEADDDRDKTGSGTNNDTAACEVDEKVMGGEQVENGREEVVNNGAISQDDVEYKEDTNKTEESEDGTLHKCVISDNKEVEKTEETRSDETPNVSNRTTGQQTKDTGNDRQEDTSGIIPPYETPEEEENELNENMKYTEEESLHTLIEETKESKTDQNTDNTDERRIITYISEHHTERITLDVTDAGTIKIQQPCNAKGEAVEDEEAQKQEDGKEYVRKEVKKVEETEEEPTHLSMNKDAEGEEKRKLIMKRKETEPKMKDDADKEDKEGEEEKEETKEGEVNAEINKGKKENETPSENGGNEGSENGGGREEEGKEEIVGKGDEKGGGGGGGGGGGKRRRRRRKSKLSLKKDVESEKEGDSAEQEVETNAEIQNDQPHLTVESEKLTGEKAESEETMNTAAESKESGGRDDKAENTGEGHEVEPESKTEAMKVVTHHSIPEKGCSKDCDGEEASSNTIRNINESKPVPILKRISSGMNRAPQFSDVAKQIMKEVQETRDRRNKCLRDLRSMKPKAARIYMVRKYKEKKTTEEKEAANTATLGEDISGVKSDTSVKSLTSISEETSHSSSQASTAVHKHSNKINSSPKENMEAPLQSEESNEVSEESKEVHHSPDQEESADPVKDRADELREDLEGNGKSANSSPGPEIKTLTQLSVECSASSSPERLEEGLLPPSSTAEGERKQQTEKNEKEAAILPDITEVTRRPLVPLLSKLQLSPDSGKVNSCMVEGSEPRQPDSDDTLSKKSVGTEAEATEGRADQCLAAAGRARVCCVSSITTAAATATATATATTTATSAATVTLPRSAHPVIGAASNKVTEKTSVTKDVVDSNGNFEAGKAEDERPLKETGNVQPKVVGVKHKSGVEPGVELLPLCNSPRSAGGTCTINSPTALKQDRATREHTQDLKETQTPKSKSEVHTSVVAQRRAVNLEILQNAEKARREKVGIFLKEDDCVQRVSKTDKEKTTRSMKQDGNKVTSSLNTSIASENGIEGDALEGPWATPQLARVVQELVVSRKFNMSSAQAKKRQQNLTQLDASQKDRTLIFDSSRLMKTKQGSEKSENPLLLPNDADQRQKVEESKNASKITGGKNGRGGANGGELAQASPTNKKRQLQRQAAVSTDVQSEPASATEDRKVGDQDCLKSHGHPQSSTNMTASEEPTETERVQTDKTSVTTVNVSEEYNKCEVGRAKLIDNDNCRKMQSSLKIEKLSRSPKQTRMRLHKVVENLSLKHSQVSPKSSPSPTSPGFSSCNSSPISTKDSPKSPTAVSPSLISSQMRTSRSVAQSPRAREPPSSLEIKVTGQNVTTETTSPVCTPKQSFDGKEICPAGESVIKNKDCEISSPLRKTPSRSDPPTELIFNFLKLPQILTDHCNTNKKDQQSITDASDLQMDSRAGYTRNKERQKVELQLPRVSKSSTGKLDSDILQFFESQQQKPREILRNETVIQEHFKDSNSVNKLKSDSDKKLDQDAKKSTASTPQSKGCSQDNIEPGKRDRTSSDPMDRVSHENTACKLRAVKSFDETSVTKSSSEEDEKPQKMKSVEGTMKHVTSESHEGKQVEQGGVSKAGEKNFSTSTVTSSSSSKTDASRQTAHSAQVEPEEDGHGDKGKTPASVHSQESMNQRVVVTRNMSQESIRRITKTEQTRIAGKENSEKLLDNNTRNPEPSETGQTDVDSEVTPQSTAVAAKKKNTLKDKKLSKVQMDESQEMKNREGIESESFVNNSSSGSERREVADRMLTNGGDENLTQDCLSTASSERPEDATVISQDNGGTLFVAVGQELKENTKEAGMQKTQIGCEKKLPLQDDLADGVANSSLNKNLVLQAALPPLPQPPPVSFAGHAHHSGSSPTQPDPMDEKKLDTKTTKRAASLQDDQHQQCMSEDSKEAFDKVVCPVTKNPDRKEVVKKPSRDSVTFHLTLVATGSCKKERNADQTPPETSKNNTVIQKRTFLETCVDDDPHQHGSKDSQSTVHNAPSDTVKAAYTEVEKTEDIVFAERLMETNKTASTGRGGANEASGRGTAARRLPRSHRRLTKTISEGSFTLGQQEELGVSEPPHQNPEKLPRPPSLLRSRTESEFSPERLASATAVECVAAAKTSTVSEIFARGVYGRLKAKSRSVENIRLSSLCCVEIPFPTDAPAPPVPAPRSSVFAASSSSSCRIVGVLKKKYSVDNILDSKSSPKVDFRPSGGFRGTTVKPKTEILPVGETDRADSEHPVHDTASSQDRSPVLASSSEASHDTTTRQVFREKQEKLVSNTSDQEKVQQISPSEGSSRETPIYQNIPEALLCQKKAEAMMAEDSLSIQVMEQPQQKSAAADQRKPTQKFIHIYENVPIIAGREPQDEAVVMESPKRIVQQNTEKPSGGNDFADSPSSSSWSSTSPLGDVFFPSKRATFEKTSLKRKQQPESESRIEKQKSNYMKQRTVRVGILKKQKSDITGVRLQKLHYFDTELPGELRRSYSVSGGGVQSKGQGSPKNGAENGTDPEGSNTDTKQKEGREELIDLERRCHSSISGGSNTSRSSAIDRILQTCAPCISSNTTGSTLDLSSSPMPRPKPTQKKSGFYYGGDTMGGEGGRSSRRQHTRTKHPYKSSYSSSDVTLLTSGTSSLASQDTLTDRQSTKAAPEECMGTLGCAKNEDQISKTADAAESSQSNGSQDTGSTSGLASSEHSSTNGEATNTNKHIINDNNLVNFERKSSTPTPTEQIGEVNSDTDFYSELLDTILSVVDGQEQSFSGEIENLCSSEGATSQLSEEQSHNDINKTNKTPDRPAVTSDSDSTTSVDSELAEVRRRITERFPPTPRSDPEASQESVLASPSAVCPMPDCAACRSTNLSEPLMFAFDQPITPPVQCEPGRAASLPFVDHTFTSTNSNDHFTRSSSLPHDSDIYHSTQVMCRHDQDEEEYWSAGEDTARGTPQSTPRHQSSYQGHLPQHLKQQCSSNPACLQYALSSPENSLTKDSVLQDFSPRDSSPLTDSGVEMLKGEICLTCSFLYAIELCFSSFLFQSVLLSPVLVMPVVTFNNSVTFFFSMTTCCVIIP
ncbi:hypothetical protein E2C01_016193 [Portunus trituberculatus]|uniref:Uncharacterized protein n=1 Tax=Portunus trituberculatus TaxID=210409 RepID=A0A5B7DQ36_PORTR|nr:hypothetical protein [Portunus trituberculatus]